MMSEEDYDLRMAYNDAKHEIEGDCRMFGARLIEFYNSGETTVNGIRKLDFVVKVDISGVKKKELEPFENCIHSNVMTAYVSLLDQGKNICCGNVRIEKVGKPKGGLFW